MPVSARPCAGAPEPNQSACHPGRSGGKYTATTQSSRKPIRPDGLQPHQTSFVKLRSTLEETIAKLTTRRRRILVIGDQVKSSCSIDRARLLDGPLPHAPQPACPPQTREIAEQAGARINQMLAEIQAEWPGKVVLMRPVDYFCDALCPSVQDGIWLYFDSTHFSVAGSRYMGARVADLFETFLKSDGSTARKQP